MLIFGMYKYSNTSMNPFLLHKMSKKIITSEIHLTVFQYLGWQAINISWYTILFVEFALLYWLEGNSFSKHLGFPLILSDICMYGKTNFEILSFNQDNTNVVLTKPSFNFAKEWSLFSTANTFSTCKLTFIFLCQISHKK